MLGRSPTPRRPARRACSTPASLMSPRAAPATRGSSASRSWTATASTTAIVTAGDTIVLTPRLSPKAATARLTSASPAGSPQVRRRRSRLGRSSGRWSRRRDELRPALFARRQPHRLFDDAVGANTDIYVVGANGGAAAAADHRRRASTPTRAFRPTARKIVFESDRSGTQQLYVMNADGTGQRRISFGGGWYAAPDVEPRRRVDRLHPPVRAPGCASAS